MILKNVHLIDSFMVYIFPNLMNVFFVIIVRTFMQELPIEVEESAKMDGANDVQIYWRIILPICVPVLVTIGSVLGHQPLEFLVRLLRIYVQTEPEDAASRAGEDSQSIPNRVFHVKRQTRWQIPPNATRVSSDTIRMAATMVATLPIILVYPFLQRYFVKGMTLGAVKS